MSRRLAAVGLVVVALIGLAVWYVNRQRGAGVRTGQIAFPCEVQGYPCTWDEVDPEIVRRTKRLGEIAMYSTIATPDLREIARFLAGLDGMAEVALDGTWLRFRLEGGRPAWVTLPSEMDHHLPPGDPGHARAKFGQKRSPVSGVELPSEAARRTSRLRLRNFVSPRPLYAATQQGQRKVAGEPGEGKKALILAPFEFEFQNSGRVAKRARLIKDYREKNGGAVTYHADFYVLDDNPIGPAPDDVVLPSQEVVFDDFLHWDTFDLIIVYTHGGRASCNRPAPVGGATITDWQVNHQGEECPIISAGRAKQSSYGSYKGVELHYWGVGLRRYTRDKPAPAATRYSSPDPTGWEYEPDAVHPGLTEQERRDCAEQVYAGDDSPRTDGGKPCVAPAWKHELPMILLWTPFFEERYPAGLERTIVLLAACHSGYREILLRMLARRQGSGVSAFGFDDETDAGDATHVMEEAVRLIDHGYDSEELKERLGELDRSGHLTGVTMSPGDSEPPSRPPELREASTDRTHGRDIVQLIHPGTGRDLDSVGTVNILGVPGDGRADSLALFPTLIGVSEPDFVERVPLQVRVMGEGVPDARYVARIPTGREGAFRHEGPVALGRDARLNEVVDLEVRTELPGGTVTRWVYKDVSLLGCWFTATVSGPAVGGSLSLSGADVQLREDPDSGVWSGRLFSPQAYSITENTVYFAGTTRVEIRDRPVSGRGITIQVESMGDWPGRPKGERLFTVIFHEDVRRSGRSIVPAGQAAVLHSLIVPNDGGPSPTGTLEITPSSASGISGRFRSRLQPRHQILTYNALVRPREVYPEIKANEAGLTGTFDGCR